MATPWCSWSWPRSSGCCTASSNAAAGCSAGLPSVRQEVTEHGEVVQLAGIVVHLSSQDGFAFEAERLEHPDRARARCQHFDRQLPKAELRSERDPCLEEGTAHTLAARLGGDDESEVG